MKTKKANIKIKSMLELIFLIIIRIIINLINIDIDFIKKLTYFCKTQKL